MKMLPLIKKTIVHHLRPALQVNQLLKLVLLYPKPKAVLAVQVVGAALLLVKHLLVPVYRLQKLQVVP
jgi:hypothetical protein